MSEPLKKPGQVPESYQPQKPEMMRALEAAQVETMPIYKGKKKNASFQIDIFHIDQPLYAVGRTVRVTHGAPDCFPKIDALIKDFGDDDVPSAISDKTSPIIAFGICLDHIDHGGNQIEFTYMRAILVRELPTEVQLPEGMLCHTIPAGYYARNHVCAKNIGDALGTAYVELDNWLKSSEGWESCGNGEYEVFTSSVYNPETRRFEHTHKPKKYEMEKWGQVRRKTQQ